MSINQLRKYNLDNESEYIFELDSTSPTTMITGNYRGHETSEDYIIVSTRYPRYSSKHRIQLGTVISIREATWIDTDN